VRASDWTVVIPVKPAALGKSRLGTTAAVARALALDTITAAASVASVVVVTGDAELPDLVPAGVRVMREPSPAGIAAALALGTDGLPEAAWVAALLGDLPALTGDDLADALALAAPHARAFVPDADGTGTSLVTARAVPLRSQFGRDSAARHRAAGLVELPVPPASTVRRDVDTPAQLAALLPLVGPHTRAALASGGERFPF
jgi:2-phospho-L-lactate guanylyltransferase